MKGQRFAARRKSVMSRHSGGRLPRLLGLLGVVAVFAAYSPQAVASSVVGGRVLAVAPAVRGARPAAVVAKGTSGSASTASGVPGPLLWGVDRGVDTPDNQTVGRVSCPSESLCVATDDSGDIVTSTDPIGGSSTGS